MNLINILGIFLLNIGTHFDKDLEWAKRWESKAFLLIYRSGLNFCCLEKVQKMKLKIISSECQQTLTNKEIPILDLITMRQLSLRSPEPV